MKENKDVISRRNFFKKAAGTVLPLMAMAVLPNLLTSCEIELPEVDEGSTTGCGNSCKSGCKGGCTGSCGSGCASACTKTCKTRCTGKAWLK